MHFLRLELINSDTNVLFFFLLCHCFLRYEAKRTEIETWLQRMENRLEQMNGKIGSTADVLEAQQKEQKVCVES